MTSPQKQENSISLENVSKVRTLQNITISDFSKMIDSRRMTPAKKTIEINTSNMLTMTGLVKKKVEAVVSRISPVRCYMNSKIDKMFKPEHEYQKP